MRSVGTSNHATLAAGAMSQHDEPGNTRQSACTGCKAQGESMADAITLCRI